jgi:uncharacterized protein YecT (DUF1311 family)
MKTTCLALVLALTAPAALAAEPDLEREYSPQYTQCLNSGDAAKGVTVAMATCINEELTKQDRRLNVAYAAAMKARGPKAKTALRNVQRRWIRNRDKECSSNLTGGTIDMIERAGCHLELTTKRALELEHMTR